MASESAGSNEPRVISMADVPGERIDTPGFRRVIKTLLVTSRMTVHAGVFESGQAGSHHVHRRSEEVTYIVQGVGEVTVGDQRLAVRAGDIFYGPPNVPHQFRNIGETPLIALAIYCPPDELPIVSNLNLPGEREAGAVERPPEGASSERTA